MPIKGINNNYYLDKMENLYLFLQECTFFVLDPYQRSNYIIFKVVNNKRRVKGVINMITVDFEDINIDIDIRELTQHSRVEVLLPNDQIQLLSRLMTANERFMYEQINCYRRQDNNVERIFEHIETDLIIAKW